MINENYRNMLKDKSHPFHDVINFSEDGSSFIGFDGKEQATIAGDRDLCENVVRELIAQTYLANTKDRYITEHAVDGNRADLVAKIKDEIAVVIEVKQLNASAMKEPAFNRAVRDAFNQVRMYTKEQKKEDLYASVVFVDIDKLINEPSGFTLYHNKQQSHKFQGFRTYSETGIYIETKRFNTQISKFDEEKIYHHFPAIVCIEKHTEPRFKTTQQKVKMRDAVRLPTASSDAYGIKNVRDIKDHENYLEKKDLTQGILETSLKAYHNKNRTHIASSGKSKDLLFSLEETIDFQIEHSDYSSIYLVMMNGAVIDGQNSLDSFRYIMDVTDSLVSGYSVKTAFGNKLKEKIQSDLKNISEIKLFLDFVSNSYVNISLDVAKTPEEARETSITKNKTMLVTKNELTSSHSNIQIPIQIVASDLMGKFGTLLRYQKQELFFDRVIENKIASEELVKLLHVIYEEATVKKTGAKKDNDAVSPYSHCIGVIRKLSGKTKPAYYKSLINNHVHGDKKHKSASLMKIENEIREKNNTIKAKKIVVESLQDVESEKAVEQYEQADNDIKELQEEVKFLRAKLTSLEKYTYASKNIDMLNDIILLNSRIKDVVLSKRKALMMSDPESLELINGYVRKSMYSHILGMLIFKTKKASRGKSLDVKKLVKTTNEDIESLFDSMVEGFINFKNMYNASIVQVKNAGHEDQEIHCKLDDSYHTLETVRGVYLNV